ncbi:hypothetical protein RP20_CCG011289 [Aedes albopictus]|nr:hypothetical protein RP20_CCG011289 [Aedes albopictus]
MAASFGGVLLTVVVLIGACQGDFGLNVEVPNLRDGVMKAIGSGIEPLSKAKASLNINPDLDESGALDAVVEMIDRVSASVKKVFCVTQTAVRDNKSPSKNLFSKFSEVIHGAEKDLEDIGKVADVIKHRETHQAIVSNLTTIKSQETELDKVVITIAKKVEEAQGLTTPVTSDNVGVYVTPAMVNAVTKRIAIMKSSVDNLASLMTVVIRRKIEAVKHVTSVNSTANESQKSVAAALNVFNTHSETSRRNIVQNLDSWLSTVETSFSPIVNAPETFNKGNISALTSYLDSLNKSTTHFVTSASNSFKTLQKNIFELLNTETKCSTDALYNTTKTVVYANLTSVQKHPASSCPVEYVDKLKQSSVQVSRLAACLSSETTTILGYHTVLSPMLQQLQNNAIAISAQQIGSCLRPDGPCSSVYFSSFDVLSLQVVEQLSNLKDVLSQELKFAQDRVDMCVRATTADIADNLKTLLVKYGECLHRKQ